MRLYVDLDSLRLRSGLLNPEQIAGGRIELKRGDTIDLDVVFVRDSVAVEIDAEGTEATGRFMLKRVGEFDSNPLVSALSWVKIGTGQSTIYRFSPSLNTVELNAELGHDGSAGNDIASADLTGEIEWIIGSAITSTIPFSVRVYNDVIKGSEGAPGQATPFYPAAGEIELLANKGQPEGYASLGSDGKVPAAQLPATAPHNHPSTDINDSSAAGRAVVTTDAVFPIAKIVVEGAGSSVVNGDYFPDGASNGKPKYTYGGNSIHYTGSRWVIEGTDTYYRSLEDAASPSLVSAWSYVDGDAPLPTVTAFLATPSDAGLEMMSAADAADQGALIRFRSPDNTLWQITVNNDGALVVTAV